MVMGLVSGLSLASHLAWSIFGLTQGPSWGGFSVSDLSSCFNLLPLSHHGSGLCLPSVLGSERAPPSPPASLCHIHQGLLPPYQPPSSEMPFSIDHLESFPFSVCWRAHHVSLPPRMGGKDVGSPKKPYRTGVLVQCPELSPWLVCSVTAPL